MPVLVVCGLVLGLGWKCSCCWGCCCWGFWSVGVVGSAVVGSTVEVIAWCHTWSVGIGSVVGCFFLLLRVWRSPLLVDLQMFNVFSAIDNALYYVTSTYVH